ncbi:MoaD/ThiS family protein [Sphingosinicella sp. YJ22]|uniref:MoaD/ThiS family protein n=1 Tax=Sphingosinicella sp. YJ22 TaxID=1104780 RepID=UPI00140C2D7D|nr:MoaD/ThiS family protein [Sphingosinicella sp. YJ22]
MDILFFGKLGDRIGREIRIEPPPGGCTVRELRALLASLYPAAEADLTSPSLRACVGDEIVAEDFHVGAGRSVEFFPPLSGG